MSMSVKMTHAMEPIHSATTWWDLTSVYVRQDMYLTRMVNAYVSKFGSSISCADNKS